jgi:hypothetical protein
MVYPYLPFPHTKGKVSQGLKILVYQSYFPYLGLLIHQDVWISKLRIPKKYKQCQLLVCTWYFILFCTCKEKKKLFQWKLIIITHFPCNSKMTLSSQNLHHHNSKCIHIAFVCKHSRLMISTCQVKNLLNLL